MKEKILSFISILILLTMLFSLTGCSNTEEKNNNDNKDVLEQETTKTNGYTMVKDSEGIEVPVPNGYVVSKVDGEQSVKTGLVIYEGTDAVTNDNKDDAQKNRNQWVWVSIENPDELYIIVDGKYYARYWYYDDYEKTFKENTKTDSSYFQEPKVMDQDADNNVTSEIIEKSFEETMKSVAEFGGFYIGRYETGDLSQEQLKVVKGNDDIVKQTWYQMYEKSKNINNTNQDVKTNMIWGNLWFSTLKWINSTGNKTIEQLWTDSSSWGNHSSDLKMTGSSEEWKANNIYDLAGNALEWTMQGYHYDSRVSYGGSHEYSGAKVPVYKYDVYNPTKAISPLGTRSILYIPTEENKTDTSITTSQEQGTNNKVLNVGNFTLEYGTYTDAYYGGTLKLNEDKTCEYKVKTDIDSIDTKGTYVVKENIEEYGTVYNGIELTLENGTTELFFVKENNLVENQWITFKK